MSTIEEDGRPVQREYQGSSGGEGGRIPGGTRVLLRYDFVRMTGARCRLLATEKKPGSPCR